MENHARRRQASFHRSLGGQAERTLQIFPSLSRDPYVKKAAISRTRVRHFPKAFLETPKPAVGHLCCDLTLRGGKKVERRRRRKKERKTTFILNSNQHFKWIPTCEPFFHIALPLRPDATGAPL
uniref:Uncharacterized protein n=1 Tax=Trichuris muris TaxID=70415 RepID=A0A5S6QL23_TRIMR